MATKTRYYSLGGGLDVVTPALSVDPGACLAMINFEPWQNGGYRRIDGFERFDGRPKPSEQRFRGCDVSTVAGLSLGTVVTGGTSGATGTICGIWDDDGTYGTDSIGIMRITGTFQSGETITGGGSRTIDSAIVQSQAPNQDLEDLWTLECQDSYRADILVVPGANAVRGVWQRKQYKYAVRDNAGVTAGILHLASASGWTTTGLTLTRSMYFTLGGGGAARALPLEGETITGTVSGATGVVHRTILHAGATATNDASGYVVLRSVTGTFNGTETFTVGGTVRATSSSVATLFSLPVGGEYKFINHNFYANSATFRTYGVNGVGPAFEIDEGNYVSTILMPQTPLAGQPTNNTPYLIEEHGNTLFMAFPGGSMQATVNGNPMQFNGFLGAAEFGMGDEITGLLSVVGKVLVVHQERETRGLFGEPATIGLGADQNIELKLIGDKSGARLFTSQKIGDVFSLDDLGISSMSRTDAFGDFIGATISQKVQPIIAANRAFATDSTIVRSSNQYRLYFSTGDCLIMYIPSLGSDNRAGSESAGPQFGFASYPFPIRLIYNTEDENGAERTYFCSDSGYVYEDRIGTNFDGDTIAAYVRTAFNHVGSPAIRKRFRRVDLELTSSRPLQLRFVSDLAYGATDTSSGQAEITTTDVEQIDIYSGGGFWDGTDNWDEFLWDGQSVSTARANLSGSGENIGFLIFNESASVKPFVLQGLTLHFDSRRLQR